jgi:hypothetical protein
MGRSSKFGVIRFAPDPVRGESLNVGLAIFNESELDIRVSRSLDKVRSISAAVNTHTLLSVLDKIKALDNAFMKEAQADINARVSYLSHIGPLAVELKGSFSWDSATSYEERIAAIMKHFIEPEPAVQAKREKRTRLLTELKKIFRARHVMASKHEGLDSHRIISAFELDDGLVADMVLKNGQYHIMQSVDVSSDEHSARRVLAEIGISALVIERAKMKFGDQVIRGRLVYAANAKIERIATPALDAVEHQGAELINWNSAKDRSSFIQAIVDVSIPSGTRSRRRFASGEKGGLFH